jgi:cell division protein FtsL
MNELIVVLLFCIFLVGLGVVVKDILLHDKTHTS